MHTPDPEAVHGGIATVRLDQQPCYILQKLIQGFYCIKTCIGYKIWMPLTKCLNEMMGKLVTTPSFFVLAPPHTNRQMPYGTGNCRESIDGHQRIDGYSNDAEQGGQRLLTAKYHCPMGTRKTKLAPYV